MCGATEPLPKTYSAVEMNVREKTAQMGFTETLTLDILEILVDIIEYKCDPSKSWETADEYLTIQDILDRAHVVIKREKGETCR